MSDRGDRQRDLSILEREYAFEQCRHAQHVVRDSDRERLLLGADLHREAAELYERLADVFDRQDGLARGALAQVSLPG